MRNLKLAETRECSLQGWEVSKSPCFEFWRPFHLTLGNIRKARLSTRDLGIVYVL